MKKIKIKEFIVFTLLMFVFGFAMAHDKDYDYENELIKIMENSGLTYEIVSDEKEIERIAENKALPDYYTDFEEFRDMIEQQSQTREDFVAIVVTFVCPRLLNLPPPFTPDDGEFNCQWSISDPYNEVDGFKFYTKDNYSSTMCPSAPVYTTLSSYWGTQPYQSVWTAYLQMYRTVSVWIPNPFGHWVLLKIFDDSVYTTRAIGFW